MDSFLKHILAILALSTPILGVSAAQSAAFCTGSAATESLRDRMACVSQLVASKSEEVIRRMGIASQRTVRLDRMNYSNQEFGILFDPQRMREGIEAPRLRFENHSEPSICGAQLIRDNPIYYCTDDRNIVLNISEGYLNNENLYGRVVALGRLSTACMIAHEIGHQLQDEMSIIQVFIDSSGDPELVRRMNYRGELFSDFFAGAFMAVAREIPEIQRELGPIANLNVCGETMRILGADATGVPYGERDHGTSAQRMYWFNRGVLSNGNIRMGNTFYPEFFDLMEAVTIN